MQMKKKTQVNSGGINSRELEQLSDEILLRLRIRIDTEIRRRGLRFSVGEIGEGLVIKHFNESKGLPKLLRAPRGTKNVDALSRDGDRYSIKTVLDAKKTGTVYPDSTRRDKQLFEYLLIVRLNAEFELESIHRLNWEQFVLVRQWDKRMSAWYVGISRRSLIAGESVLATTTG